MQKYLKLILYTTNLSLLTINEFFSSRSELKSFIKSQLAPQEYTEIKKILDVIYLNTGFTRTIIAEYANLQETNQGEAKNLSVMATALMLLEDFLLDEKLSDEKSQVIKKLIGSIEEELSEKISFMKKHSQSKQRELWTKLRKAQVVNDFESKGLWLPALGFPHNHSMTESEVESLRKIGLWIKSFDDWADKVKDEKQGKKTLFTNTTDEQSKIISESLREKAFVSFSKNNYIESKKNYFLYKLHVQSIFFYAYSKDLDGRFRKLKKLSDHSFTISIFVMIVSTRLVLRELMKL